jgi:hypothetical protein
MGKGRELLGPGEFFQHTAQVDHIVSARDRSQWRVFSATATGPPNRGYGEKLCLKARLFPRSILCRIAFLYARDDIRPALG